MMDLIKRLFKKLPFIRRLVAQRSELLQDREHLRSERKNLTVQNSQLQAECEQLLSEKNQLAGELRELKSRQGFVPPGHFYSPVPDLAEIRSDQERIFQEAGDRLEGIELDAANQLELLESMLGYYREMPFTSERKDGLRYYFENPAYSYSDAIMLHGMIRHLQPRRIIEVGSGFSSCMILDTNEVFLNNTIETTFIEPYPELLTSLLKDSDHERVRIIPTRLQEVDLGEFDALTANDILFIDSTHVGKIGSDVNRILFEILPRLSSGVYVHFHDIMYPFEYPKEWVFEGRAWNEAYLLRAFLQSSRDFQPVLMNTYMTRFHHSFFSKNMPLCLKNPGGSIWLRRE